MDDAHLLALGRAVHSFQRVEWLTLWLVALVVHEGDFGKAEGRTFGQLVGDLRQALRTDPASGGPAHQGLEGVVQLLVTTNILRQDVFHAYPMTEDNVVRRRPEVKDKRTGEVTIPGSLIPVDSNRLNAAARRFDVARVEAEKVFRLLWAGAFGAGPDGSPTAGEGTR